uniref:Uncharacterized protein n=1 Tax=Panagrolaimus sp. JU765 TaxID=591449 RepID=A0AC34Q4M2_9BILA
MVKIMKIDEKTFSRLFGIPKIGFRSPMKDLWLDAMEYLEECHFILHDELLDLHMEIASKLNHLKTCVIYNCYSPSKNLLKIVDAFPNLPNLTCFDFEDDEILKFFASKSNNSNPWKKL